MTNQFTAILLVFLPLFAACIVGLNVRSVPARLAQMLTVSCMVISAILSGLTFVDVAVLGNVQSYTLLRWIDIGTLQVDWALNLDVLTSVMLVVVTWVSTIVHIYSVGYMSHDPHRPRFMAYLSLFTFFMLMLVTSDNFLQLFVGWEGVGLCSYLLIGFWFSKDSANKASMKAFLVNRVADIAFALGVCLVYLTFDSLRFDVVFANVEQYADASRDFLGYSLPLIDTIGLLLFVGCMGKSAQLLLHTWLPDAMEGPTPVSALIHAATMVTAGVFLVARSSALFEYAPIARDVITIVGGLTAFFAASIGLVQNDIKRVIAYSTCSQLGYMFFACGVSAYAPAVFHLMTHAFFKALLFLGAGSVIHAMSDEQDMRKMGGIRKLVPYTCLCMWIGSLALAGVFPLAGFYSKDMILEAAYAGDNAMAPIAFGLGILAAFMTAFYSWRLLFMTFHGKPRATDEVMHHVHESPPVMLLPLVVLVVGSVCAGFVGYHMLGMVDADLAFWRGAIVMQGEHNVLEEAHHVPLFVKLAPLFITAFGIALAWILYIKKPHLPAVIAQKCSGLYQFLLNKWYFDELYDAVFVRPSLWIGHVLWRRGDVGLVDPLLPDGSALLTRCAAKAVGRIQTGYLYHYAFAIIGGLLLLITLFTVKAFN